MIDMIRMTVSKSSSVLTLVKRTHHAVALDRKGKRLLDSALPNDQAKLRALIGKLKEHGQSPSRAMKACG